MDDFKEMDIFEKECRLHDEIKLSIDRLTLEHNLTYVQVIGILEHVKQEVIMEFMCPADDEDEFEEGEEY